MQVLSQSSGHSASTFPKRPYRHSVCTLAYVRLDHANGGIIRNLNETGMAIQAVGRLHPDQIVHLRFELIRPRAKFELVGQVTWADEKGQAGLRFTELSRHSRRSLQDWILTDLLAATSDFERRGPVLNSSTLEDGLVTSATPFRSTPLIVEPKVKKRVAKNADVDARMFVPFWPGSIRQKTLSRWVDGMVIVSAVLLFSIIVAELTDSIPAWPTLLGGEIGVSLIFALLYAGLCRLMIGNTLGKRLAQVAAGNPGYEPPPTDAYRPSALS